MVSFIYVKVYAFMIKHQKYFLIFTFAWLMLFSWSRMGQAQEAPSSLTTLTTKTNIVYFYSETCVHCKNIKPLLKEIEKSNKETVQFRRYEVRVSQRARDLFDVFLNAYGVPVSQGGTPSIFIGDTALIGEDEVKERLANIISFCKDNSCPLKNGLDDEVGGLKTRPLPKTEGRGEMNLAVILGAAAIDSINPCAIGVLLLLIGFLVATKGTRRKLMILGAVYIFAVYLTYFLAGLGLLHVISRFNLAPIVKGVAGGILLIAGIISFKEVLKPGTTFLRIPDKAKGLLTRWLTKASIPGTFVAGMIVSGVELPCTGEVYLGILSILSGATNKALGYWYLGIYNLVFVAPLILILLLAIFGVKTEKLEKVFKGKTKMMRILAGLLMLALSAWLLIGIFK